MNESKPWYLSKTVWASIVTILASLGGLSGITGGAVDSGAAADAVMQVITALTGLVAVFGRVTATNKIRS
jgi:hypothetical protein